MIMKKILIVPLCAMIVLAVIFSAIRITYLNNTYPNPKIIEHKIGEIIDGGGVSVRVKKSELIGGQEFEDSFKNYTQLVENDDGSVVSGEQYKVLLIYIDITNKTSKIQNISVAQMYAETLTWTNGIDAEIFGMLNKDNNVFDPQYLEIDPDKNKSIVLTYMMYDFQFQKKDWEEVKISNFDLSLSRYPVKHIVKLL